jgi:subtilisin-like proprotein convertase family protein
MLSRRPVTGLLIAGLLASLYAGAALATVPATVRVEGAMTAIGGGAAPDGSYDLIFSIYLQQQGGAPLWSEGPVKVKIEGGRFGTALGTASPLVAANLPAIGWFGIKVGQEPELERQPLHSVLYAMRAGLADSLACSGCVQASHLAANALAGYVKTTMLSDVALSGSYSDLSGTPNLAAYAKTGDFEQVAYSGQYKDLQGLPAIPTFGKACGTGLVVAGILADGTLTCVALPEPVVKLPPDGIDEISNNLIFNQFVDAFASKAATPILDNNPIGIYSEIEVGDVGFAQSLTVSIEVTNSDMSALQLVLYDSENKEYVLFNKNGKKGDSIKTSYPDQTKTISGDLTYWVGKNPKGKWRLQVIDTAFLNNATDGEITSWSVNLQTLSSKKIHIKGDLVIDGTLTVGTPSSTTPAGTQDFQLCAGTDPNGMCKANLSKGRTFLAAAKYCASQNADICTDSQAYLMRRDSLTALNANWTASFADNDSGQWNAANGGTGDNHSADSIYLTPCCHNVTPKGANEQTVAGIRVLALRNTADKTWDEAVSACAAEQADLCSKSQYWVLRQNGKISVNVWSSDHSDNDSTNYEKGIGSGSDDPSPTNKYGYACCATTRTGPDCPVGGTNVDGVCMAKLANANSYNWNTTTTACAALGANVCSVSQSAVLRSAGKITASANWTASFSDNDGSQAAVGVGSTADDPQNSAAYAYACCW